jgi:hypothetical protein
MHGWSHLVTWGAGTLKAQDGPCEKKKKKNPKKNKLSFTPIFFFLMVLAPNFILFYFLI